MKEEPNFVKDVVATYSEWMEKHLKNLMECGFDFIWSFDDMASKEKPYFTKEQLWEFFLPYMQKAAKQITVPWIFHSDGNLFPVLDDLLTLGMSGLHPLEPGAMDLRELKRQYGKKLCLIGNIDIDHTMIYAIPEEIHACIDNCIDVLSPGGGYIISDSNSVPSKVTTANIIEIASYIKKAGAIY
jgi:uroporphyrinogen decarboxylase